MLSERSKNKLSTEFLYIYIYNVGTDLDSDHKTNLNNINRL